MYTKVPLWAFSMLIFNILLENKQQLKIQNFEKVQKAENMLQYYVWNIMWQM